MKVDICNSCDPECDQFVLRMPDAKLCHLFAWAETITRAIGHKSFYLVAREGSAVRGILPLTLVRSRLFGSRMVSQAFSNYGGPLTEDSAAANALYECALKLTAKHKCESLELRNMDALPYNLHLRTDKITMYLPLAPDPADIWKNLRHKIRNRIRKSEGAGVVAISGGAEKVAEFYRIWTKRMHQLGTPCYPRKLFSSIAETFKDNTRILLACLDERVLGGLFVYRFGELVESRWGAVLTEYNDLCPNYLLQWAAMKHFGKTGAKWFDFGRSTVGSGQHEFKKRWGATQIPLAYQYWTAPGHRLSIPKPDDPKYRTRIEMWKKLPLALTRLVGPYISRSLP